MLKKIQCDLIDPQEIREIVFSTSCNKRQYFFQRKFGVHPARPGTALLGDSCSTIRRFSAVQPGNHSIS
jgi:hypothetical protein